MFEYSLTRTSSPTKRHKSSCCNMQEIKKAAVSLRDEEQNNCPTEGGVGERGGRGSEEGRGEEKREVWLDDRMAAFTQRVVSPAETHFTIQHNRAIFRSHLQLISTAARSSLPFFSSLGFVLFCLLFYFDATSLGTLPCILRMDRLRQSRRTKRIKPLQRTAFLLKKKITGFFLCL